MNFRVNLLAFIFLLATVYPSYAQPDSKKYPELVKRIQSIDHDKSFSTVKLSNEEFMDHPTDGGGELIGYFRKNEIQKIKRQIVISIGIETYNYYFTNGSLVLVYETFDGFLQDEKTGDINHTKTERNFIGRYYFKNNKLIDSETTGHNRFEDDEIDIESTLLKEMNSCLSKLKR